MFLITSLLVLTVCYWISAAVGDFIFTSEEERGLPAAVRTGLGFIVSVLYFSAAWQWMSIGQAWLLGVVMLAMYALPRFARRPVADNTASVRNAVRDQVRGYLACLLGALVFFAPLIAANNYGPFTEGGGDITLYADGTRFLIDRNLTSRGAPAPSSLGEILSSIREATENDLDGQLRNERSERRLEGSDWTLTNPPAAESAVYRVFLAQTVSPFAYPPFGEFFFLSRTDNYHIYFGVEAFLYGILLASAFHAFRRARRVVAWLYVAFIVASHSLVSVFYNMYAGQAQALAVSALVLPALYTIRPLSAAGLRVYGTLATYLWIAYVHFLSVVGPLFLVALAQRRRESPAARTGTVGPRPPRWASLMRNAAVAVTLALVTLMAASAGQKAFAFVFGMMKGRLSGDTNVFMGDRIPLFGWHWLSFVFGSVSQQHFQPFAQMPVWLLRTVDAGTVFGIAALVLGLLIMLWTCRARSPEPDSPGRFYLVMYAVIVATVAIHLYWAQTYIYTQAKGAQNVLLIFYAGLVLPLAAGLHFRGNGLILRVMVKLLAATLFLFGAALLVVRLVYAEKLAFQRDRSGILESSFFEQARRIRQAEPNPFVLFEPRKSADLYVSIQPFFGAKMASTRHLSLLMIDRQIGGSAPYLVDASDLIKPGDLPRLWTLAATAEPRAQGRTVYTWKAERLTDRTSPGVLLFADDYQQNQSRKPRGSARDLGMFSYVRNGSGNLYLPAGQAADVEVKLAPQDPKQYWKMVNEVSESLDKGVLGPAAPMELDGKFVTLKIRLAMRREPVFARIARFHGEYWLNVRVDGKEIATKAGGDEKLSGSLTMAPDGTLRFTASWSGIAVPDKEDWVGVFPVGGDDTSRLAFSFTGGKKSGSTILAVPPRNAPDEYELRLYRAGSWDLLTASEPLVPQAAKP